jgi:hypothetical protein
MSQPPPPEPIEIRTPIEGRVGQLPSLPDDPGVRQVIVNMITPQIDQLHKMVRYGRDPRDEASSILAAADWLDTLRNELRK